MRIEMLQKQKRKRHTGHYLCNFLKPYETKHPQSSAGCEIEAYKAEIEKLTPH
jgi:hypothetical protein